MDELHDNFTLRESGLIINTEYPHLGASPDGISSCMCHGTGCVEIKCPFSARDCTLVEALDRGVKLCMTRTSDGALKLDPSHAYWYQVQLQLLVSKLQFADFVVWTPMDIHIERVQPDITFLTESLITVKELYVTAILPELLAKWFTRPRTDHADISSSHLYCYCRVTDSQSLVLVCQNSSWFCPDCKKLQKLQPPASSINMAPEP